MLQLLVGTDIPFMKYRRFAYVFSGVLLAMTLFWFFAKGPKYSVDFTGGTLLQIRTSQPVHADQLRKALEAGGLAAEIQQMTGGAESEYLMRFRTQGDPVTQVQDAIAKSMPGVVLELRRNETVGPKVGQDLRRIESRRVDGFVVSGVEYDDPRLQFLLDKGFPFVAFGRSNVGMRFSFVDVDGKAGMRKVVEHLVARGRRRIAALSWPDNSRVGQDRMAGYREAMQSAGIDINPDLIARGGGSVTFGHQVMQGWLAVSSESRPEAVGAFNDGMAVGAMQAIQETGLVVGVVLAVTGFDDLPMTQYLTPPLTTVRLPVAEIGERVIKMLVNLLENNSAEVQHELVEPELVVRQSSTGDKASGD